MRSRSIAKNLAGSVKEILGTCVSIGCTIDGKDPKDLQEEISNGDVEIPSDHDPNPPPPLPRPPPADGLRLHRRGHQHLPLLLRQHHGGLPLRPAPRVQPRRLPRPPLLHQWHADAPPPFRLLPRARHRLRLPGAHPPRSGRVRLLHPRPLPRRPGQRLRRGAVAGSPTPAHPRDVTAGEVLPWEAFQLRLGWLVEYQHRPRLVPVNSSWGIYFCSPEASPPLSTLSQFPFVIGFSCVTASNSM